MSDCTCPSLLLERGKNHPDCPEHGMTISSDGDAAEASEARYRVEELMAEIKERTAPDRSPEEDDVDRLMDESPGELLSWIAEDDGGNPEAEAEILRRLRGAERGEGRHTLADHLELLQGDYERGSSAYQVLGEASEIVRTTSRLRSTSGEPEDG